VETVVPEASLPESTGMLLLLLAGVAAVAWLVAWGIGRLVTRLGRRSPVVSDLARRGRRPFRILAVLVALIAVLGSATGVGEWRGPTVHALGLALVATVAWLLAVGVRVVEDLALARYDVEVVDNRHARRVRTQVSLLRRLVVVLIGVLAAAAMLLTFPAARAAGASILASAGVISIVAGLAAQTSLANVFAGLQLAFTDAIRVDDVVVVEGEFGRIEEITLTYVVVHVWDDRRMVLPSTYFTTTPFANWTRTGSALLGAVELDVDWSVPVDRMRAELDRLVDGHPLWDGRTSVLQVTDAVGSTVRVRALVSGRDAGTLWDLRCHVREGLVQWLQQEGVGLPRVRVESSAPERAPGPAATLTPSADNAVFSGDRAGVARSEQFTGPSPAQLADRADRAERTDGAARGDGADRPPPDADGDRSVSSGSVLASARGRAG
jgi:small-conductance mechanosensitive channel